MENKKIKNKTQTFHTEKSPKNWEILKIREFAKVIAGGTPDTKNTDYWNGDIPWMNSGDLNLKKVKSVEGRITDLGLRKSNSRILPKYSILIGLAGQGKTRGTVAINLIELCTNQSVAAILPNEKTEPMYLYYNLNNRYDELRALSTGDGGRGGLNLAIINNLTLSIPPKFEQIKIATILSTWDTAIETLEQLITKKERYKKALMQKLLTGKVRFKEFKGEKWRINQLSKCVVGKGEYGINAPAVNFSEKLPRYLRITDIDDVGNYSNTNQVSVNDPNSSKYILKKGDILFARTGNTTGKTYLYSEEDGELVYAGFLIKFHPNPKVLLCEFLKQYCETQKYWNWVKIMSSRSGQPGINGTEYGELELYLPSTKEQQKIVDILSLIDKDIQTIKKSKANFINQKNGLMQQLLTGKIRVKN